LAGDVAQLLRQCCFKQNMQCHAKLEKGTKRGKILDATTKLSATLYAYDVINPISWFSHFRKHIIKITEILIVFLLFIALPLSTDYSLNKQIKMRVHALFN
jgi:hypothetical protein